MKNNTKRKMHKIMHKIRNCTLLVSFFVAVVVAIFSVGYIVNDAYAFHWKYVVSLVVSALWILLFTYANKDISG